MSEKKENSYDVDQQPSFIDYLKEHNSLLIAGISSLIAIFSFFVNALSYISLRVKLQEYFILPEMIKSKSQGNVFFNTVTLFVYCIMLFAGGSIIGQSLKRYFIYSSLYRYNKIYAKKSRVNIIDKEYPIDKQKQHSRVYLKYTIYKILGCIVVVIIIDLLFEATNGLFFGFSFFLIATSVIITLGSGIFIAVMEAKEYRKRNIDKIVASVLKNEEEIKRKKEYKYFYDKFNNDSTTVLLQKWKITKMHIISCCFICASAVISSFCCIIISSTINATQNKVYQIYYDEGKTYAVVYQDADYYAMEEASIKGNDLYIYLNRQRFLSTDDISFEHRGFDNIIKTALPYIQDDQGMVEETGDITRTAE